jgi:hypothetical protein
LGVLDELFIFGKRMKLSEFLTEGNKLLRELGDREIAIEVCDGANTGYYTVPDLQLSHGVVIIQENLRVSEEELEALRKHFV